MTDSYLASEMATTATNQGLKRTLPHSYQCYEKSDVQSVCRFKKTVTGGRNLVTP